MMSKKSKALKRRGVGTTQEVHSHNRVGQLWPHQMAIVEQGMKRGSISIALGHRDGKVMSLREYVEAGGTITDEDIGIHRDEGP